MNLFKLIFAMTFTAGTVLAESRPSLFLSPEKEINSEQITLGEIAEIRGNEEEFSKLLTDLRDIDLGPAPRPLGTKTFKGEDILAAIDAQGIPREAFGYSIPVNVLVKRAGRVLSKQEVLDSVKSKVNSDPSLDLQVKKVDWDVDQVLPLGATRIDSELLGSPIQGKLPLRISVTTEDTIAARFLATAQVDDWKSIPVLKSSLDRGMLVNPEDLQMIRSNLSGLPSDVALTFNEVAGKRLKKSVTYGEPLRRSDIDVPPVVEKGKLISMKFQSGGFIATASGIALQEGQLEDYIEVRNDRSNKIVKGKVISKNEVLVSN